MNTPTITQLSRHVDTIATRHSTMMTSIVVVHPVRHATQHVTALLDGQQQAATRVRLVHHLAPALLQMLHIPPHEPRSWHGWADTDCHCNGHAVQAWIKYQLMDPELAYTASSSQALLTALGRGLQHPLFALEDSQP